MRKDLAKCTTESPRHGISWARAYKIKYGGRVKIDSDPEDDYLNEYGGFRSSARHRQHNPKNFSDCLGALRGNIRKNVGRPWDDVYSEFAQLLDRRSLSGFHIWTHLLQEVEVQTYIQDGVVYKHHRYGGADYPVGGYYVHPETGILEYKAYSSWRQRKRGKKKKISEVEIPVPGVDGMKYCLVDGLWFRCKPVQIEKFIPTEQWYGRRVTETVYNYKRSANRKEIVWIKNELVKMGILADASVS